ncbi:acyl-CoA N-acyltransferase [Aspergillus cavernicola]|uniref:Acyl-CoA N-acyltransferase n=1 Tax=Aspergillus cavernicola TaxID=176166 RepID=A0ABR4HGT9_9EURO
MLSDYNELLKTHDVFVLQEEPSPSPTTTDATTPTITTSTGSTGRKILGSIILNTDNESNSIQINNLVVDPTAQGRGYGRLLMEFAEERARVQGRTAVTLFTNVKMYENLGLYMKLGFVETGRRVEDGYERVFFWKDL